MFFSFENGCNCCLFLVFFILLSLLSCFSFRLFHIFLSIFKRSEIPLFFHKFLSKTFPSFFLPTTRAVRWLLPSHLPLALAGAWLFSTNADDPLPVRSEEKRVFPLSGFEKTSSNHDFSAVRFRGWSVSPRGLSRGECFVVHWSTSQMGDDVHRLRCGDFLLGWTNS